MKLTPALLLAFPLILMPALRAEAVKDREGAVRGDRARMENDARWIYNDVDRGFAEAARTGRPLLVVLRCVPCLSCVGLDAEVLTEPAGFESVKAALENAGLAPAMAEITYRAEVSVALSDEDRVTMQKIIDALEDLDDVQNVYGNFDISDEVMASLAD